MNLPKSQESAFAAIAMMPAADFDLLHEAIRSTIPSISISNFTERVAATLAGDPEELSGLIAMLVGASTAFERSGSDLADFVAEVCESAEKRDSKALAGIEDWQRARERLAALLSLDETLGLTAKALGVISEAERLYCTARIISDIRPIFRTEDPTQVSASVVIHSLRIAFHTRPSEAIDNVFVTLVKEDLRQLKTIIDRALQKDDALQGISNRGGVKSLAFKVGKD